MEMTLIQSAIITSECSELISPFLGLNFHTCKKEGLDYKTSKAPLPVSNPFQLLTKRSECLPGAKPGVMC